MYRCLTFLLIAATTCAIASPRTLVAQDTAISATKPQTLNRFLNVVNQFQSDFGSLNRFYNVLESETRCQRLLEFNTNWIAGVTEREDDGDGLLSQFDSLTEQERQTAKQFLERLNAEGIQLQRDLLLARQLKQQHPFTQRIIALVEARQRIEPLDARKTAEGISELTAKISAAADKWKKSPGQHVLSPKVTSKALKSLKSHLFEWYRFSDGYDPMFSWWIKRPYKDCDQEFSKLLAVLKEAPVPTDNAARKTKPDGKTQERDPSLASPQRFVGQMVDVSSLLSPPDLQLPTLISEYREATTSKRRKGRKPENDATDQRNKRRTLFEEWQKRLTSIDFASLKRPDQVDYLLLKNDIDYELAKLDLPERDIEIKWTLPEDPRSMSGFPIGAEALQVELDHEMIRYSPEQLVAIAEQELQWCRTELIKASNEMGLGDDWRAAIEKVKGMHVEPGQQPAMIKGLAREAINYLKKEDRLSIPPLAVETWRMTMMSPERQLVNPFFLGGEVIQVSYPTDTMKHRDKLESMRGNNIPFARATVHHELIPGHHLQIFSSQRNKPYRRGFGTPFWMEGWALYWEMMLYDAGFPKTAEDRIGFLVWRSHRCARIVFSLNFHLGNMTPPECVDLLVNWVGFDRNNAAAEVRRSVGRAYSPLYQAAYMLGGLQIRQLRKEVVDSGKMTEKLFHDAILQENSIPISLLRAILTELPLTSDQQFQWKFYGEVAPMK